MSTINVTNLKGRGGASPTLPDGAVVTGVATATTFSGTLDGSLKTTGTPTLGLGVTINSSGIHVSGVATVGVLTGGTYYGDGSNLSGIGETIAPWHYNPDVSDPLANVDTGIGITFNKKVVAGSGTATLKIVNAGAAGTTIQSWGVSSCTFNVTEFTMGSLVSNLVNNQTYQVDIPSGFIVDSSDTDYTGTAFTFTTSGFAYNLWAIGWGGNGALGVNNRANYSSPVQVPGITWNDIMGSGEGAVWMQLATKSDGTLWAWGQNDKGNLGQNSRTYYSSPVQIPGTTWSSSASRANVKHLAGANGESAAAIKTDGTLWVWGNNEYTHLGLNSQVDYSSPVQVPGTTWNSIGFGSKFGIATKTDGTLWVWGHNDDGALGQNQSEPTKYSSPVQVPGTTWNNARGGSPGNMAMATKTDGTLWMWGDENTGSLAQNNRTQYSSPVQVPGTTWTKAIGTGAARVKAIKTDGTLWAWGYNGQGQLGQNNIVDYSSPVQIPGTWGTEIKDLGENNEWGGALKADGTAWMWGYQYYGQLGQNQGPGGTSDSYSSPVQLGSGTDWWKIGGINHTPLLIEKDATP